MLNLFSLSNFLGALQQLAAQQAKTLAAEMKAVTSQFSSSESSIAALSAKNDVLSRSLDQAKDKLSFVGTQLQKEEAELQRLAAALDKANAEFGEGTDEVAKASTAYSNQAITVEKLRTKYSQSQTDVNKFTGELSKNEAQLNQTNRKLDDSERSLDDLAKALDDSGDAAKDAANNVDDVGDSLDDAGQKSISFGDILKANVLSDFIMDGFRQLAGFVKDFATEMITTAATVKAETAQFEQTFGGMQEAATTAIGRVADEAGILDTRLKGSATSIFAFAKASGADTAQAMGIMERALVVAADSAAYYDRSLEDVNQSLQSFLKGNYANDAALGVSATETTRNAKANELYGQSFKDLDEAQKQITLLAMVEEANELSGAMGQAAREADGWENVTGNLKETWRQFQATVGTPFLENLIPIIQNTTVSFQDWVDSVDWDAFSQTITNVIQYIIDNGATLVTLIGTLVTVLGGLSIISTVVSGIGALGTAISFLVANPIVLVIAAIVGLVALIATKGDEMQALIQKVDDFLQNIFVKDWREVFGPVLGGILNGFFDSVKWVWDLIKGIFDGLIDFIRGVFTGDWKRAWGGIQKIFSTIWGALVGIVKAPINAIIDLINGAIGSINMLINGVNKIKVAGFSVNIPTIPKIPRLAAGAVIPPNREFLAMLGDQSSGYNIETPERLLREIVRDEAGGQIVVSAPVTIQVNGAIEDQSVLDDMAELISQAIATKTEQAVRGIVHA